MSTNESIRTIARRRRNLELPTGAPYDRAFTLGDLTERGWTRSMVMRHLGQPNAVIYDGFAKYQYDTRRVFAAEGSPGLQMDLLSLEDVQWQGLPYLARLRAYVRPMMKATLEGLAIKYTEEGQTDMAQHCQTVATALPHPTPAPKPPPKPPKIGPPRPKPPPPVPPPLKPQ